MKKTSKLPPQFPDFDAVYAPYDVLSPEQIREGMPIPKLDLTMNEDLDPTTRHNLLSPEQRMELGNSDARSLASQDRESSIATPTDQDSDPISQVLSRRASARISSRVPVSREAAPEQPTTVAQPRQEEDDLVARLIQEQENQKMLNLAAGMADAGQQFTKAGLYGAGIEASEADKVVGPGAGAMLREQSGAGINRLNQQLSMQEKQRAIKTQKDFSDPNSKISKEYQKIAVEAGFPQAEGMSAEVLEKTLGWLFKKKEFEQRREEMSIAARDRQEQKNRAKIDDFMVTAYKLADKPAENFGKARAAVERARSIDPNSANLAEQVTMLYDTIRGLDPDSVVREGEIALLTKGGTLQGKARVLLEKLKDNPRLLDAEVMKQLKNQIEVLYDKQKNAYVKKTESLLKQAERRGIDSKDFPAILPYYEEAYKNTDLNKPIKSTTAKKGKVIVTDGKETYEIDESDLAAAEKDGFRRQ